MNVVFTESPLNGYGFGGHSFGRQSRRLLAVQLANRPLPDMRMLARVTLPPKGTRS